MRRLCPAKGAYNIGNPYVCVILHTSSHIHDKYVPSTKTDKPHIVEKIDFAGDVLTNERAVGAQNAMLNGDTDYERLSGVNHRPGGLHAVMNLVLVN